jgi:hypothetical protein
MTFPDCRNTIENPVVAAVDVVVAAVTQVNDDNVRSNLLLTSSPSSPPITLQNLLFAAYEPQLFYSNTAPTRTRPSSPSNSNSNNDYTDIVGVVTVEAVSCSNKLSQIEYNNNSIFTIPTFQSVYGNETRQRSNEQHRCHRQRQQQDIYSIITTALAIAEQKI